MYAFQSPHVPVGHPGAAAREPFPVVEILSDNEEEQPAQSSPLADSPVAQLVDMGFTPEQAAQVCNVQPPCF